MRLIFACLICLFSIAIKGFSQKAINIPYQFEQLDAAKNSVIRHDPEGELQLEDILADTSNQGFTLIKSSKQDLGFTTSYYWIKLTMHYNGAYKRRVYLEVARPVTNVAELYVPNPTGNYDLHIAGDGVPFHLKEVPHRSQLFNFYLHPGLQTLYLRVASDGEALNLPIKLWDTEALRYKDYKDQLVLGIYYGLLTFVILIYFFFYARLNEKSFLYYILYVAGVFLLQFSLDGFYTQYLFPDNVYLANRGPLFSSCFGMFFLLKYLSSFLKIKEVMPKVQKWVNAISVMIIGLFFFSLTDGFFYNNAYLLVNVLSLVGMLIALFIIIRYVQKGIYVDPFFIAAFVFLIAGVAIFIMNNLNLVPSNFYTEYGMKMGTALEVICLSFSMANKFRELQKAKEKAQQVVLENLQEMNKLKDEINIELEKQVKERTAEVVKQKEVIEEKNKDIVASINYAKRIQTAILTSDEAWRNISDDHFILFKPKDVVSGDFYWAHVVDDMVLWAVADCTGHGVPGAFMSMIGSSYLNEIVSERKVSDPATILNLLRGRIISALVQNRSDIQQKDGMDVALCCFNKKTSELTYAGANNPLVIVRADGSLSELKPDKMPIGSYVNDDKPFSNQVVKLNKGDVVYSFSDGYADQFGGPSGKKFKYKPLYNLFLNIFTRPANEQLLILDNEFENWRGNLEQIDDVCVVGVRV